ncbi:MAG: DUF87 domain-containing protein, partial [Bacilli bacterium]|nr:DUF87 domain-containing protein [Bacilli bacterium]
NVEPEPVMASPYFNYENDNEYTNTEVQPEPINEEPVINETYQDNSLNNIFNPDGDEVEEEFVEPTPQVAPVYSQPAPKVQSAPVMPQPEPLPEQPKKRVLHWDDDDDVQVDIPKAYVRPPYKFPPLTLLDRHENPDDKFANDQSVQDQKLLLEAIFSELKIGAQIVGYTIGPSITQFDVKLNEGVSVKIFDKSLADISIRLGGVNIIFKQLVTGKSTSGLQVPNYKRISVGLFEALSTYPEPNGDVCDTLVPFGKDINGDVISLKIADCPHMLVAGTTGSGKSVFVHNIILSLIMRNRPEDLKILLVDPKGVEMTFYKKIPHLICPMITEASKANVAFGKLIDEMDRRNKIFNCVGVRELKEYNKIAPSLGYAKLPTIVAFIDEYADLSEQCKDIEGKIQRIAQKARTAGIHIIIATQRPSVNIIGGVIKGNIPTRVALSVNSQEDSRVIIGESGAEKLLGNGDMLIDSAKLDRTQKVRVQSAFADTTEINKVANFLRQNYEPMYWEEFHDLEDHTNDVSVP